MNTHDDIRTQLAAYCGDDLDQAQRSAVESHLAGCADCRAELAELELVLRLVRSEREVDPPPWLSGRIMARVREAQQMRRPWWQRLLFPLHIKLPLEAAALLVVCITGYYLTRTVETELAVPTLRQAVPETPGQVPQSAPKTGSAGMDERLASPADRQPPPSPYPQMPPESHTVQDTTSPTPRYAPPPSTAAKPSLPATAAPAPATTPLPRYEQDKGMADTGMDTMQAAPRAESRDWAPQASAPALRKKSSSKSEQGITLSNEMSGAAGRSMASPATVTPLTIRLSPADPATAGQAVRQAFLQSGGKVLESAAGTPTGSISGRIPPARFKELLERLERLGRVTEKPTTLEGQELLEVVIRW